MTDPTKPTAPTPKNTPSDMRADSLRDARLVQALQHMPDAHMQPSAQTRSAVLQEAMRAVGPAIPAQPVQPPTSQRRWWHAWLGQPGQRVPWGAAVASVAIFGFITVMWYGQEVPDAAPERSAVVAKNADTGAEAKGESDATAKRSDKNLAQTGVQQASNAAAPSTTAPKAAVPSAVVPEHKLATVAPSETPQAAVPAAPAATPVAPAELARARVAAPSAAPATPPVADVMAEAAAPAAQVAAPAAAAAPRAPATANVATAAGAPTAQARLERRSKAEQAVVAAADHSQAREADAPAALAAAARARAAPSAPPPPMAALGAAPAKARADSRAAWVLTLGDAQRSIRPEQAQKFLSQLRGLSYAPVTVPATSESPSADAIRLDRAGIEAWVITPGYVTHYLASAAAGVAAPSSAAADARGAVVVQGDAQLRSTITPAQYSELRRLAMELGAEPSHPLAP